VSGRSGGTVALGIVALVASWAFGSVPLAVVSLGLLAAGLAARLWARSAARGLSCERRVEGEQHVEGENLAVHVRVRRGWLPAGAVTVRQPLGALDARDLPGRRGGVTLVLEHVPRGRFSLGPVEVILDDPLGLERVTVSTGEPVTIVVRPRVAELTAVFSDGGARELGGRRSLLRRASGFELHAVREYQDGEPLRAVHWPTTARRAQLMVKELDDAPRDDVVVVLDQDPGGVAGAPGASSFDAAVRAAGSLVRAHAARGRRAALVLTGGDGAVVRVRSLEREWPAALDALAAALSDAVRPLAAVLSDPRTPAARAPELVVVTARPDTVSAALEARLRDGRRVALVAIDAPTYAGAMPSPAEPVLLRAAAAGIPVAVVRAGEDLRGALEGAFPGRAGAERV